MIKQSLYKIRENQQIARGIFRMVLEGDTSAITNPGQFVNIKLEGNYLRRPISVADWDETTITLLYKVVGKGTNQMAELTIGKELDLLTGLGNGFTLNSKLSTLNSLLIGGGIGLAPLYGLAKRLGKCTVVIGAATKDELFYVDEFKKLGAEVIISTDDGSEGVKGFVTDALASPPALASRADLISGLKAPREGAKVSTLNSKLSTLNSQPTREGAEANANAEVSTLNSNLSTLNSKLSTLNYIYMCGPMPMMKAVCNMCEDIPGQVSLEERMGCGFGACVGCSVKVKRVDTKCQSINVANQEWIAKRVCKDGPVFNKEDVIW